MNMVLAVLVASSPYSTGLAPETPKRMRRTSDIASMPQPKETARMPQPHSRLSLTATTQEEEGQQVVGKVPVAPTVDSALLRFVSAEKKLQQQTSMYLERASVSSIHGANTMEDFSIAPTPSEEDSDEAIASSSVGLPIEGVEGPLMAQCNRNSIAETLSSLGVDRDLSLEAGDKVQEYILVRMTRRRVRAFLKERASQWSASYDTLNEFRVPSVEAVRVSYGFEDVVEVFQEYGFTGTDICSILTHSPSLALMMPQPSFAEESEALAGETLDQTLDRSFRGTLMKTLGLRKYDARKVLRNCPGLLTVKGSKQAKQIVSMMTALGVSKSAIARDKAALPSLLSRSPSDLFRLVSFLSSGQIRMKADAIGPLLRKRSSLELLDLVAPVAGSVPHVGKGAQSKSVAAMQGKTRDERRKMIAKVYQNMTETVRTIRYEIGTSDMDKVIAAFPSVLLLNAEEQILPVADFLMDELEIDRGEIASLTQLYPVVFSKDIDQMKETISYLLSLGVQEDDMGSIFRAFPALLTTSIEDSMKPVVEYLRFIGVENIGAFITKLPPILSYSVEKDILPKWNYLQRVSLQPICELEEFPAYFSYRLDRRIKTRYDYLSYKGINRHWVPVPKVLRFGDADFAKVVARDDDGGKKFKAFCEQHWKGKIIPAIKPRNQQRNRMNRRPRRNPNQVLPKRKELQTAQA